MFEPNPWKTLIALALLATAAGACASSQPGIATARIVEAERPVDPREDNAAVLERTVEGLVLQLEIDGENVAVTDARVLRVPKQPPRAIGPGMIGLSALAAGRAVYTTAIPDEEVNTEEQGGIVRLPRRQLTVMLPTGTPVTVLEVTLRPGAAPTRIDLAPQLAEWCGEYRQQAWAAPWCRAASTADPPQ